MRLFVAICLDERCKNALCQAIATLRGNARRGNFSNPQNLHLTLAFLGETDKFYKAEQAITQAPFAPFFLEMGGLGRFRREGGDIWWMGVKENEALRLMQRRLCDALRQQGFQLEDRAFRPHLTLGRQVEWLPGFDPKKAEGSLQKASMEVQCVSLMESSRPNGQLTYTERFRWQAEKR